MEEVVVRLFAGGNNSKNFNTYNGSTKERTFNLLTVLTVRESNGIVNPDNRLPDSLRDSSSVCLSTYFEMFAWAN